MPPELNLEWIRSQLETLYGYGDEIADLTEPANTLRPWSALKLITLAYSVDVYTKIISSRFDDWYYIDAMAGSGAFSAEEFDTQFVGSPIIAASVAAEPFSHMYFIEEDSDRAKALKTRLDYVSEEIDAIELGEDSYTVLNGDANDVLPKIPQRIINKRGSVRGAHHFAFIDNVSGDIYKDSLAELGTLWGDWLINYPPIGTNRARGDGKTEKLTKFYGTDEYLHKRSDEARLQLYLRQLESMDRDEHRRIRVDGAKDHAFHYELIYGVRETEGGNDWLEAIDSIKDNIERLDGDDITRTLDVLRGDSVMGGSTDQYGLNEFG